MIAHILLKIQTVNVGQINGIESSNSLTNSFENSLSLSVLVHSLGLGLLIVPNQNFLPYHCAFKNHFRAEFQVSFTNLFKNNNLKNYITKNI